MGAMKFIYCIVLVCVLESAGMAGNLAMSFADAAARGDAQERNTATKSYQDQQLIPYYENKYGPILQSCLASTGHPDTTPFEFVVAIGTDGEVLRLYNDRQTNIFSCVRQTLEKDNFPKPPVAPYYLHIEMRFSQ